MRTSGILMPIASLPGEYGIGSLGVHARSFADALAAAGQTVWQILPVGPTGYGDSPYQSVSAFAGNPYFIDLDTLCKEGLLTAAECRSAVHQTERIEYKWLFETRFALLKKAYERFLGQCPPEWGEFCARETWWVDDYAMYMTAKAEHDLAPVAQWPEPLRRREGNTMGRLWFEHQHEIGFYKFLQFEFFCQWREFKTYVNERGISLLGDLPIYVSPDSADVWADPHLFELDDACRLRRVAGVPPDAFSVEGQLWGNPLYDWAYHEKTGYEWWTKRLSAALQLYDEVRIDHFRGFDSYWAIPATAQSAMSGEWCVGPGMKLFCALEARLGRLPIVAEDLGILTAGVRELQKASGYPGMAVLQFAFGGSAANEYLPHNHDKNTVVYTGTHDNTTTKDWFASESKKTLTHAREYLCIHAEDDVVWAMVNAAEKSCANTCILPIGDLLSLGREGRINVPATLGSNWDWRLKPELLTGALLQKLYALTAQCGRI